MKKFACSLSALLTLLLVAHNTSSAQPRPQDNRGPGGYNGPGRDNDRDYNPGRDYSPGRDNDFGRDKDFGRGPGSGPGHSGRYHKPHVTKYDFAGRKHVEKLADDLYNQANNICWDLHNNFSNRHPQFTSIYRDMYEIKESSKRINQLVQSRSPRRPGSDDQIERELVSLNRRFQEFEADLRDWNPTKRRTPGNMNLGESLAECEDTLHHLMDDYGVRYDSHSDSHRNPGPPRGGSIPGRR